MLEFAVPARFETKEGEDHYQRCERPGGPASYVRGLQIADDSCTGICAK